MERKLKHFEIATRGNSDSDLLYSLKSTDKKDYPVFFGLDQLVFFYMHHRGEQYYIGHYTLCEE